MQCFHVHSFNNPADLPDQGQGGSQAVEDAEALMVALENLTAEAVPEALRKVEKVRYDRASFVQKCSRDQARGPEIDQSGKQTVLNGHQFAKVASSGRRC
jgi:salicylate hydroxylase